MNWQGVTIRLLGFVAAALLATAGSRAESAGDALRARLAGAAPQATLEVGPGVYEGSFVIDRPLRLLGQPGAILQGDRRTHVLTVLAPDVEVAGFIIRGSGRDLGADHAAVHVSAPRAVIRDNRIYDMLHGIYVRKAGDCRIEGNVITGDGARAAGLRDPLASGLKPGDNELCDVETIADRRGNGIHLWNSAGHVIRGNTIRGTRDGVYFSFTDDTVVQANRVSQVRYGLHYMYSDGNTFEANHFSDNAAGAALMYSQRLVLRGNRFVANRSHRAYGLLLQSVDDTRIERNEVSGNTLGIYLENNNRNVVRDNHVTGNYVGLRINDSTADCRFSGNRFTGNIHPVETSGLNGANQWSDNGRGNLWEGALRLDLDGNGVADVAHREPDLFGPWRRTFPAIGLLSASPGERLLRFIHGRLALPGVPRVTDPRPLATPTSLP